MAGQPFASRVEREIKICAALLRHVHQSTLSITNREMKTLFVLFLLAFDFQLNLLLAFAKRRRSYFDLNWKLKAKRGLTFVKIYHFIFTASVKYASLSKQSCDLYVLSFPRSLTSPAKTYFAFNSLRHYQFAVMKRGMHFLTKREKA